ncbi:MAG: DUF4062 domain-containing protein [Thermoleophilia bacterium]
MPTVFISSAMTGLSEERRAAMAAITRMGWSWHVSERTVPYILIRADDLETIHRADVFVLILGGRYGAEDGRSPCETEYDEAVELGKPILVFVQDGVERDHPQERFLARVSSGWGGGRFRVHFTTPDGLGREIVQALNVWRQQHDVGADELSERVSRLIDLPPWLDWASRGRNGACLVVVPGETILAISAEALTADVLPGVLGDVLREHGMVAPGTIFTDAYSADGVQVTQRGPGHTQERVALALCINGAIIMEGPVAGTAASGTRMLDPTRISAFVAAGLRIASAAWGRLDDPPNPVLVGLQLAVANADGLPYGDAAARAMGARNGGPPARVLGPEAPLVVRARHLTDPDVAASVAGSVHRALGGVASASEPA